VSTAKASKGLRGGKAWHAGKNQTFKHGMLENSWKKNQTNPMILQVAL